MSTVLSIQLYSKTNHQAESVQGKPIYFYSSDLWDAEAEQQLIKQIHELMHILRPMGVKLTVNLSAEVSDPATAVFLINKNINRVLEINTHKLTIREVEIISLIMLGLTNNEIADKLFISYETVRSHRKNILEKTGAKNTASLIN
jgi:DNA-binding CsgD family transcriptional regulator